MNEIAFIIAEYNPFHNGHLHHIRKTRTAGAKHVVCIMSGNYVQRGDIAICDKNLRARFAVENGADLVLELPLPFVLSGASAFASGAAKIIERCNVSATVSFGASANIETLSALRRILDNDETIQSAKLMSVEQGYPYPSSLFQTVARIYGEHVSAILNDPNNILGLEYMAQIGKIGPNIDFYAVPRNLAVHDADLTSGEFASAKYIRQQIYSSKGTSASSDYSAYLPKNVNTLIQKELSDGLIPADRGKFSVAAIARLSGLTEENLRTVNGISQGLENRIEKALKDTNDLYALFDAVKTKRYTHARIRQSLLSAILGIRRTDMEGDLPYVRVLAMNAGGRRLLREFKSNAEIPFVMNISEAPNCRLRSIDCDAGKLFELCRPVSRNINAEFLAKPFVLER